MYVHTRADTYQCVCMEGNTRMVNGKHLFVRNESVVTFELLTTYVELLHTS